MLCRSAWLCPLLLSWLVTPQSFASLHLYWVWALLVHPTPKNQSFAKCVHHTYLHVVFHRHSKVNYLSATFKTFKMYSCFVFLFSSWGRITCFTVSFMVTWLHTLTSMHNVLVQKSQTEQGNGARPKLSEKKSFKHINNKKLLCAPSWCTRELSGSRSWSWVTVKGMVTHLVPFVDMTYIPLKTSLAISTFQSSYTNKKL